jgi:hypothetical protein
LIWVSKPVHGYIHQLINFIKLLGGDVA